VVGKRVIPVINNGIFDEISDPVVGIFDPGLYERNRYEKLEEFKWFLGQRFDLKITIFYAERSKIQALGFFGRKIRHPGGVVRSPL
jgi:hypothetical protein